ncbi:hypothetical protein F5890DRAFT_1559208 [Lentinula detonsa]|uniref:DNA 3'-5' helicase n=1 Tax=Lentinula detonsa TaxID=2804962 RepID=A0AA38PPR0_9AGAR|nr:hypothetical protein F5890DRAFT_1559208 [Lentinula detonsa]
MLDTPRQSHIDDTFMEDPGLPFSVNDSHMQQKEFDMHGITPPGRDEEGSEVEGEYRTGAHRGLNREATENNEPYRGDNSVESEYEDENENVLEENPSNNIDHCSSPKSIEEATTFLARFNIIVDPVYRITICTECAVPVPFAYIHKHQWTKHFVKLSLPFECRLPKKEEILLHLLFLRADQPLDIPYERITPIQGVETVQGYKCTIAQCGFIYGSHRSLRRHQEENHFTIKKGLRNSIRIPCQPLSKFRNTRRYIEVLLRDQHNVSPAMVEIERAAAACKLFEHNDTFTIASNAREKSAVFAQSRWDELLDGVDVAQLSRTISTIESPVYPLFEKLRATGREYYQEVSKSIAKLPVLVRRYIASSNSSNLKDKPFHCPQELRTVIKDSDRTSQFIAFLIVNHKTPVDSFSIPLHPYVSAKLADLHTALENDGSSESTLKRLFHQVVWNILSRPSDEYINNELMCPFTRFLIATTLKVSGCSVRADVIPPIIAEPQWCFRATACEEILKSQGEFNGDPMLAYTTRVQRFITDSQPVLFTTLRQNMNLFKALSHNQQGLPRFNWNIERTIVSIDGFPITVSSFIDGIHGSLKTVTSQIERLFRGCPYQDVLAAIDAATIPNHIGQPNWFRDRPTNTDIRYSFFEEDENGLKELRPRLLQHLIQDPELFATIDGRLVPKKGAIFRWYSELDEVVRGLYYLISSTWGGGSRGTEIEHLLYANHPRNSRNIFFINGLLTIVTEYQKTQSLTGAGKLIARTPAPQVNRLLTLVLGLGYWAAGYIGCYIGMEKTNCQRYFYEVFLLTGISMESKHFSDTLGSYNGRNVGIELKLRDFRQLMSCMLISSTLTTFFDLNDEDPNVVAAHESFGHSLEMGRSGYGLDSTSTTGLAPDAVARMQQVCIKWQAFLKLVNPAISSKVDGESEETSTNLHNENSLITSHFQPFVSSMTKRFDDFEERTRVAIRSEIESLGIQLLEQTRNVRKIPEYQNPRRAPVHPASKEALRAVLRRKYSPSIGFTSAEQAELVNSVGSSLHVFGIIETGGGKSLAFFGAPFLFPHNLFIVVSPLIALTQDLKRRLYETSVRGGLWSEKHLYDIHTAQLVIVSANQAGSDEFYGWVTCDAVRLRLKRIFIDEAHKIVTDQDFRSCFLRFPNLVRAGVPITFLSGSLMPRSMPAILETMGISDPALVDEIRRYSGRRNLKYVVEHIEQEEYVEKIQELVERTNSTMQAEQRGIIFMSYLKEAEAVRERLGIPMYTGQMGSKEREEAEKQWRRGLAPQDRWIVATQAFGQGVDYAHVVKVIHKDPRELLNYYQEAARAGRDQKPATCHCFWTEIPTLPDNSSTIDHHGRVDMAMFLRTSGCLRIALSAFDREIHSCTALNGELCSSCEALSEVSYSSTSVDMPRFSKKLVPNVTKNSNELVSNTVAINAANLNAQHQEGEDQLNLFNEVLESIDRIGCLDCWANNQFHNESTVHVRPWGFPAILATLRQLQMKSTEHWPFCYECWIPFRRPCNHPPPFPNKRLDVERCIHRVKDQTTQKYTPLIPTLIAIIFSHKDAVTKQRYLLSLAECKAGMKWKSLGDLADWLHKPVESSSQVPNPVLFVISFYKGSRSLN